MNLILHKDTETQFDHNGIGILTDAYNAKVKETLNGTYELEFYYPIDGTHSGEIADRCIVMAKPNHADSMQPFRIYRINPASNGVIKVYAQHISYDLAGIPVSPFSASTAKEAMLAIKDAAVVACPFDFYTDKSTVANFNASIPKSARKTLGGSEGSFLDVFGGEYHFDRYEVNLLSRRGADMGVSIRYGKNLTTLEQDRNCASVYTGVYPYWISPSGELVQLSEKVINASGNYNFTKILDIDFTQAFEETPNEEDLRLIAQKYIEDNKIGVPSVSLKVQFAQLEQTEEYKHIAVLERVLMGDTVSVVFPKMGVDAISKVVETVYDPLNERYTSVSLGNIKSSLSDTINAQNSTIKNQQAEINKKPSATEVSGMISSGLNNILGISGGSVRILDTNSDGMLDEIYIADNPDLAQAMRVWRFNYMGFAASETGYNGPFNMGATLEDGLLAEFVTACRLIAGTIQSKDGNTFFLDLDNGTFRMNAKSASIDGKPVSTEEYANAAANSVAENLADFYNAVTKDIQSLQSQVDGSVTTWFYNYVPTSNNIPASDWTTSEAKNKHLGDLFYIIDSEEKTGQVYRWALVSGVYKWVIVEDADVTKALADAAKAQDTADSKRRVFVVRPVPPYDVGDLWLNGEEILTCATSRLTGNFLDSDWEKKNAYTTEEIVNTKIEASENGIRLSVSETYATKSEVQDSLDGLQNKLDGIDGIYFYIKYSDFSDGHIMIDVPTASTMYMGTCSSNQETAPTDPSSYTWVRVRGDDGKDGIPGVEGTSSYFHVKYSDDGESFTSNNGETLGDWMGTCVTNTEADPTDFNAYTWKKVTGIDGVDGTDGESSFFYVKFSANANGNPMTETPQTDTKYMGVCSTTATTAPSSYTSYKWTQCKGDDGTDGKDGTPGAPGKDGKTQYLHIKYSDDGETFTDNDGETLGSYIGTLVDFTEADSMIFSDYTWKKFTEDVDDELNGIHQTLIEQTTAISNLLINDNDIRANVKQTTETLSRSIDGVDTRVSLLSEEVSAKMDANSVKLQIREEMEKGATKVTTSTGFTFDEAGLAIEKSGSEMKTQITENGMTVYQNDAAVLSANNQGVEAKNLNASTFLIVGGRSRFENYGSGRTGCFWIGG